MINLKAALNRSAEFARRLVQDTGGNVAILFALCAFPFIGLVGAAVDYSMASDLRARLQRATDATGLQLCQLQGQQTSADFYNSAKNVLLPSYLGSQKFEITTFEANLSPRQIRLVTAAHYDTAIVRIMGPSFSTLTVTADAQCQSQENSFEIALVLDTTGSMANSSGPSRRWRGEGRGDDLRQVYVLERRAIGTGQDRARPVCRFGCRGSRRQPLRHLDRPGWCLEVPLDERGRGVGAGVQKPVRHLQ